MTRGRPPSPPPEEQAPDPSFDLRKGIKTVVIVMTVMVIVTVICVYIARPG